MVLQLETGTGTTPVVVDETAGQYVAFRCGGAGYGIPIMSVREIRSWQPTTPLPGRTTAARGVLDIRGAVVEVFDLGLLLGGEAIEPTPGSVVLVLSHNDRVMGLLVDAVSDIIQTQAQDLMPVPPRSSEGWGDQVSAMVNHENSLIGILDLDSVFAPKH